jgi:hypothetical protein
MMSMPKLTNIESKKNKKATKGRHSVEKALINSAAELVGSVGPNLLETLQTMLELIMPKYIIILAGSRDF